MSAANEDFFYRWPARKQFDYIKREYCEAILLAGGIPILLPNVAPPSILSPLIETLDGLLLTGGGDMDPAIYAQAQHPKLGTIVPARDTFEMALMEQFLETRKAILGICRGHQVLNVILGGTLHQDLSCLPRETLTHADPQQSGKIFHQVSVEPESRLAKIFGTTKIETNSSHHQVIDELGRGLEAVALAPDGVIEAVELRGFEFVLSVQWHPEGIIDREHSQKLFAALIEHAALSM